MNLTPQEDTAIQLFRDIFENTPYYCLKNEDIACKLEEFGWNKSQAVNMANHLITNGSLVRNPQNKTFYILSAAARAYLEPATYSALEFL